ncbi:hypothetical protein [Lonepinella sp. BR2357]|uniref:hypothetical protein n=1 Tax=Lonepinella sp. BR2357 TaxID=3434549 RepID=UPI003F6DF181
MGLALNTNHYTQTLVPYQDDILYTDEELEVLQSVQNGLVKTKPHHEVMENLRQLLNIHED